MDEPPADPIDPAPRDPSPVDPAPGPGVPSEPASPRCRAARERTRAFLSGPLAAGEQARLVAHLEACEDCRRRYEAGVRTAAQLGRRGRLERQRGARSHRRAAERRLAFSAGETPWRADRGFRLRTLLMPALLVFLVLQVAGLGRRDTGASVEWREGRVLAAQRVLESAERAVLPVAEGDWCATAEGSRARLSCGPATVELEAFTGLWIEGIDPARLRLSTGVLEVAGPCTVTTAHGVVEVVRGRARLEAGARRLAVRCLAGATLVVDPRGERALAAGESVELGTPRGPEPLDEGR